MWIAYPVSDANLWLEVKTAGLFCLLLILQIFFIYPNFYLVSTSTTDIQIYLGQELVACRTPLLKKSSNTELARVSLK